MQFFPCVVYQIRTIVFIFRLLKRGGYGNWGIVLRFATESKGSMPVPGAAPITADPPAE